MTYRPGINRRRTIRLQHWDYREKGAYFVTICTHDRIPLLADVVAGQSLLNQLGRVVEEEWMKSAELRAEIELDAFVVMPNHLHGIVWIRPAEAVASQGLDRLRVATTARFAVQPMSLGSMVRGFKSASKIRINEIRRVPGVSVWQRNYFERVLRNDRELDRAREYILDNPRKWSEDKHNPAFLPKPGPPRDQP